MTTGTLKNHRIKRRSDKPFYLIGAALLIIAAVSRVIKLGTWPGTEWDENVYRVIAANVADPGRLIGKTEYLAEAEPYLYHPPLHFELLGSWFNLFGSSSLTTARALAVVASLVTLILVGLLLKPMIGYGALLAMGLLATDAWMIFSNRVSWIENVMIPIGIFGLWLYYKATKSQSTKLYIAAGAVLGVATIYKHMGVIFIMAVLIHWILMREQHRDHLKLLLAWVGTLVAYIGVMWLAFGNVYLTQSGVQVLRSFGIKESRGSVSDISQIFAALSDQYSIYVATLILAALAGMFLLMRLIQVIRERSTACIEHFKLLFAWSWASVLFLATLNLRIAHYFMLIVVPLFCYLAAEFHDLWRNKKWGRFVIIPVVVVATGLNSLAFTERFVLAKHDNALAATAEWMSKNVPLDAKVMTEESVGATIPQPYCKIWRAGGCKGAMYIITYISHTQKIPLNGKLIYMIGTADVIYEVRGFKEKITVYRLPAAIGTKNQ